MMIKYSMIHSAICNGLEMQNVNIEISILKGLPRFEISGLNSRKGNELFSRIRAALQNSGFPIPKSRIICNISPEIKQSDANILDLAIAIAILLADAQIVYQEKYSLFILGGLSLSGKIEPVSGVYAALQNIDPREYLIIIPEANQVELINFNLQKNLFFTARNIAEAIDTIENKNRKLYRVKQIDFKQKPKESASLVYIQQPMAYRAMEIAIAGWHPLLMIGSAGSGKTTLAKQMQFLLPEPNEQVKNEIYKLYSVQGIWAELRNFQMAPFIMANQRLTIQQLLGDEKKKMPGLCSMANEGILFLDEVNLFKKGVLQALRSPMAEKKILFFEDHIEKSFPADFLLIATMQPCPCGFLFEGQNICNCKKSEIDRFQAKIIETLYDRFQMLITLCQQGQENFFAEEKAEDVQRHFSKLKERITLAKERQLFRQKKEAGIYHNSCLNIKNIVVQLKISNSLLKSFEQQVKNIDIGTKDYLDLLRVARTIADLEQSDFIKMEHLDEAILFCKRVINSKKS